MVQRMAETGRRWWRRCRAAGDAGMATAEYAVVIVAAVAFAAILYKVVTSPAVQQAVSAIVLKALKG